MNFNLREKGLSLIGFLVIVLIIITIIASYLFFFNPVRKFKSARDAKRWEDTSLILNAIKGYQENNNGSFLKDMKGLYPNEWYMIVGGPMTIGCDDNNDFSDVEIYKDNHCVDISELVNDGYLGNVPVSPTGKIKWDSGISNGNKGTGYALMINDKGVLYIQSCESENTDQILIYR